MKNICVFVIISVFTDIIGVNASESQSQLIDGTTTKASSEIIGSSVVTSVSVVLGNEHQLRPTTEALFREQKVHVQPVFLTIQNDAPSPSASNLLRSLVAAQPKKGLRKEEGVQGVIDTLKTIVKEEEQKQKQGTTTTNTNTVQPVDETPPTASTSTAAAEGGLDVIETVTHKLVPGSSIGGDDDDEMEAGTSDPIPPTTDAIDDFAKHVVSISMVAEENENDTATSAEVHDAIHKISGAILSVDDGDKGKKPIETIVTDVLTSINSARNNTETRPTAPTPTGSTPSSTTTIVKTAKPSTKKAANSPKPTKSSSQKKASPTPNPTTPTSTTTTKKSANKSQVQNQNKLKTELEPNTNSHSSTPKVELPMIIMLDTEKQSPTVKNKASTAKYGQKKQEVMEQTTQFRLPGIPVDEEDPFPDEDNGNTWQASPGGSNDEEIGFEDQEPNAAVVPIEYTTIRPYVTPPTKKPSSYWVPKKPGNVSTSATRPNEFYDDEIFGYDPYQTFFHGVYVPVVEVGTLTELQHQEESSEEYEAPVTTPKPQRRPLRPSNKNKPGKKPMPALPDHLHRPRPSHLQYQHGAMDDTDPETGLLNAHFEHAGHSYGPDNTNTNTAGGFVSPDKLATQSRPALSAQVRKNFTDHHDHHIQHQHGIGDGGHGHGHHGSGGSHGDHLHHHLSEQATSEKRPSFPPAPNGNPGLEATLTSLDEEKRLFVDVNNRLALRLLGSLTNPVSHSSDGYGNMVISPFTIISSLAMMFLGARGHTAAQIDGLLQLDDVLSFNPHMLYHNVTESFLSQPNTAAALIRLLVTDKEKGDVLEFYKTRVQHFYEARVEEVDYKFAGHLAQSIINQMIRAQIQRHSYEMINHSLPLSGPMSLLTATFFDGQFAGARDSSIDNMNFIHLAALNQGPSARRLFQVPAFAIKGNHRAAYDKELDATAVELPYTTRDLSLILVMPGKPGEFAFGGVTSLKNRLNLDAWTRLTRGFYRRDQFKVVVPRFRHQSTLNLSHTLSRLGLTDIFEPTLAKFKGINGLADLHLDQNMMHFSEFGNWEKLSDTLTESNNRNLDLIRILRPHVREHYGHYGEPMSVKEWVDKTKNHQRSQTDQQSHSQIPDDVSRLRLELERLRRRQPLLNSPTINFSTERSHDQIDMQEGSRGWYTSNSNPYTSYSKVRGSTTVEFRPRRLRAGIRTQRSKSHYSFRQEPVTNPVDNNEQETVLRLERPFIYILRHNPTGMILMTGQYTEPVTEVLD